MFSSLLIEASAGSGKTFQLSNRFLAYLALGEDPADLIALTFTRKAAGEFTRRILNRLALGASSEEEAAKLAKEITPTLIGDPQHTQQPGIVANAQLPELSMTRFRELLVTLVRALDRLQLSTLDSFFTRLVSNFGPELGLAGFEMLDETLQAQAQTETLQSVLNGGALTETQRNVFLSAFAVANYGNEEARVHDSILEFVEDHHERLMTCPEFSSWGNADVIWANYANWPKFSKQKILQLQQEILNEIPDTFGNKTFDKTFRSFAEEVGNFDPSSSFPKKMSNLFKWVGFLTKGDFEIRFLPAKNSKTEVVISAHLTKLLVELEELVRYSTIDVFLKRTKGIYSVIHPFEQQYNKQHRSQGRVGFSDLTQLLHHHAVLARKTGFNQLAYRLDSQFRHWMLDEFQDTSRKQWEVIEPVISEAVTDLEGERSLFVVGDTKQSIYGWRGGDPRLFGELSNKDEWDRMKEWTMSKSWRSSRIVLDFVNLLCDSESPGVKALPEPTQRRWNFAEHLAAKDISGNVEVYQFPKKKEGSLSIKEAAVVEKLLELNPINRGFSCALLVKSNKDVEKYTSLLREHTQFPVEAEAAVSIASDSPLGQALLDWFRYLLNPIDSFALHHVHSSPLHLCIQQYGETATEQLETARREISTQGVSYHLNKLTSAFSKDLELGAFQTLRLQQILDAARHFDSHGGSLEEWLRTIEKQTQREESAKGAIQVMTVHKSKGLEFDIVILPELDGTSYDSMARLNMLTVNDSKHQPHSYLLAPNKEVTLADSELKKLQQDWLADNCYERACNFYVALTRAARALYLFLDEPSGSARTAGPKLNDAGWVHRVVGDIDKTEVEFPNEVIGSRLYQSGDSNWHLTAEATKQAEPQHSPIPALPPASSRVGRRTASKEKSSQFISRHSRVSQGAKEFGNQVHALFEQISCVADKESLPDDSVGETVRNALELSESKYWFGEHPNTEILLEQPVESIDSSGIWFSGVIDRAIVHLNDAGKATKIEILDFKTDKIASASELLNRYSGQMHSYITILANAYDLPQSSISASLLSTGLNTYVNVPAQG